MSPACQSRRRSIFVADPTLTEYLVHSFNSPTFYYMGQDVRRFIYSSYYVIPIYIFRTVK